jgi:import inner membrane translocase subunit TIM50
MIDTNPEHAALQPENAVIIKPWEGIAIFNTPDVRPILKAYDGKDIPIEYAKKEEESKRAAIEEWERKNPNRSSGGGGFLGGMFGSVSAVCPLPYLFSRDADCIAWTDKTKSTYDLP